MSYDLDIDNYTQKELISFFNLSETYEDNMLLQKKNDFIKVIKNDYKKDDKTKISIINFINNAANKLKSFTLINNSTMLSDVKNTKVEKFDITNVSKNENLIHPIVDKPYTNFIYTNPSVAFDGVLNPLERRIITKVLSVDSLYRENLCSTNSNCFTIKLATPLNNVISMKLISLEVPRIWYNISQHLGNNTMKIYLYNMVDYSDNIQTITLPDGNYPNQILVNLINNYFTNIGMGLNYLRFDINITNSKSVFYVKNNSTIDTILPYDSSNEHYSPNFYYKIEFGTDCNITETLGTYLGFKKSLYIGLKENIYLDIYFSTPPITYYGIIKSESSCGIFVDNYIFVDVNDYNKNFDTNTVVSQYYNKSFIGNNIIGRVSLNTLPDSLLINNPSDYNYKTREYYGPVKIRKLQISLIDRNGKLIDLLNNDYSLCLEFNILYS
jgi:hypothetical protein